jgi:hypothetical protein
MPRDPSTGALISSIAAAALCVKPRGMLTESQQAKVAVIAARLRGDASAGDAFPRHDEERQDGGAGRVAA